MKAVWKDKVIARADKRDLIYIEGNWYFPPNSIKREFLIKNDTPYTCPWKGVCQYFDVASGQEISKDSAWAYPNPLAHAIKRVHKDLTNYVAFWCYVEVTE